MDRRFLLIACLLGLLLLSCTEPGDEEPPVSAPKEWHYLGLGEESVTAIAVDPTDENILYAGSGSNFSDGTVGGIFKSADGGAVWDTLIRGVTVRDIDFHPNNPRTIYVTCGINFLTPQGLLRSKDGGLSWEWADTGLHHDVEEGLSVLVIDPLHSDTMYLGTSGVMGGSLYRSIDGARTWTRNTNIALDNGVTALEIDAESPNVLFAGTAWTGSMLKSTDCGETWTLLDFPEVGLVMQIKYVSNNPRMLCVGTSDYGFFYSLDNGDAWMQANEGLPNPIHVNSICDLHNDSLYVAANYNGIGAMYSSGLDSIRWNVFDDSLFKNVSNVYTSIIYADYNNTLYVGTSGIYVFK